MLRKDLLPFVTKQYKLFDKVVKDIKVEDFQHKMYIIVMCDTSYKHFQWLSRMIGNESTFYNTFVNNFYCFKFKVPEKDIWYISSLYKVGPKLLTQNHIYNTYIV